MYLPFSVKITETEKKKKEKILFCVILFHVALSLSLSACLFFFLKFLVDESYLSWLLL